MFDDIRHAFQELLNGNVAPEQRRALLHEMRETLIRAKMAKDDLRESVRVTEARLEKERAELAVVQRRKTLAEGIKDAETVTIAARFESQHVERLAVLEKKLDAALGELALLEREVEEMTTQFKAAQAGVGSGLRAGAVDEQLDPLARDPGLDRELRGLDREQRKAANDAEADLRLAELKRRMGL
ncbi:MAG: hypothetical protein H7066_06980 [Cytophagaceae bacterium]|nr:hypothetical protein [Gemmatimonadaceae bacterium]